MQFFKFISNILHPIVVPTIAVLLYFYVLPIQFLEKQKYVILSLVFIITYITPLLILIILKQLKGIQTYQLKGIQERKLPFIIMIACFIALGIFFLKVPQLKDLALLFIATSISLIICLLLLFKNIKASIHVLTMSLVFSFFMLIQQKYGINLFWLLVVIILLIGLIASSRLYLKAHTNRELLLGLSIGLIIPILTNFFY